MGTTPASLGPEIAAVIVGDPGGSEARLLEQGQTARLHGEAQRKRGSAALRVADGALQIAHHEVRLVQLGGQLLPGRQTAARIDLLGHAAGEQHVTGKQQAVAGSRGGRLCAGRRGPRRQA
jgi:hypothetical protein